MNREELAKLVSRSGFLFQLAVEDHVRATEKQHEWEVVAREYPWSSSESGRSGFVDFVAARNGLRCVFECKRTQGAEWIFLVPDTSSETADLRTLWTYLARDGNRGWGWDDVPFNPPTLRSEFCVVRGSSDDDKPMLERIAADLVRASESIAREELGMSERYSGPAAYLPVIVTNARLYACRVAAGTVDLRTGGVPNEAKFEEVTAVRFRKALPSDLSHSPESYSSLKERLFKSERCAFVIQVEHLASWLSQIKERMSTLSIGRYPWWRLEQSG